jgi:hypothetical protein
MFVNSGLNILKQFQYRVVSLVVKEGEQWGELLRPSKSA